MDRPRVIVVEDDPLTRRLVEATLSHLDIELVLCSCVAEAIEALAQAGARLVLTDLMLPEESGLVLLERLRRDAGLRGQARVAVYSADISPALRAHIDGLGVAWRILDKPVPRLALEACVRDAVGDGIAAAPPAPPPDTDGGVVQRYFAGDAALFRTYRTGCLQQFSIDVQKGDEACRQGDLPGLKHLAHSLKTVLDTLGQPVLGSVARSLERHATDGEPALAPAQWERLRTGLLELAASAAGGTGAGVNAGPPQVDSSPSGGLTR